MKEDFSNGPSQQIRGDFFQGTGMGGQMKGNFPIGPSRQKRNEFSNCQGNTTKKGRRLLLSVYPGRQKKVEVFKPADKRLIVNII